MMGTKMKDTTMAGRGSRIRPEPTGTMPQPLRLTVCELVGVTAMFLGTFTMGIDSFILSPLLSTMAGTFHATTSQIAYGVTAYAIAYAVGAPLLAPFGDRFGSQRIAATGMLIFARAGIRRQ